MQKDLQMIAIAGYESQIPLPLANFTQEIFQQAIQQGSGDRDFTVIYESLRSKSNQSDKI